MRDESMPEEACSTISNDRGHEVSVESGKEFKEW